MMRAKFKIDTVERNTVESGFDKSGHEVLYMSPVCADSYDDTGEDENNTYARWTPCGSLTLTVQNPDLFGKFKSGQEYYLDFTLVN